MRHDSGAPPSIYEASYKRALIYSFPRPVFNFNLRLEVATRAHIAAYSFFIEATFIAVSYILLFGWPEVGRNLFALFDFALSFYTSVYRFRFSISSNSRRYMSWP